MNFTYIGMLMYELGTVDTAFESCKAQHASSLFQPYSFKTKFFAIPILSSG